MLARLTLVLLFLAVGCRPADPAAGDTAGWEYSLAHGAIASRLTYEWDDGERTALVGSCRGEPSYFLFGGNYKLGATQFTLTVDDQSWTLPASQGVEGRGLFVYRYAPTMAIGKAKRRIAFQVGNWRREVRPGPILANFVRDCT